MSSATIGAIVVAISVVLLVGGAVAGYMITNKSARERDARERERHSS